MRRNIILLLALIPLMLAAKDYSEPLHIRLHDNWQFTQAGTDVWLPAHVPGTVHQDLIDNQKLADPFWGMNEEKVQWVENEDWIYRTTFCLTENQLQHTNAMLTFEGLDTYADIFLNGALLKQTDNMFVGYDLQVKDYLRLGKNKLQIYFHSPIKKTRAQWETDGFDYPADNDHGNPRVSIYTRKAPYSYGWDWGIRMVTSGVWRPITLSFYDVLRIDDFYIEQKEIRKDLAKTNHLLEVSNSSSSTEQAEFQLIYTHKGDTCFTLKKTVSLQPGKNQISIPSELSEPHLWWPNGWGEAALYDVEATLSLDSVSVATDKKRIGLRDVKVVMEDDNHGKSFYFKVNGIPLFAKGSNYIPSDALLPRVSAQRYFRLMKDVQAANHNMIRVWGGGIYEDDAFYNAADEMGILVWQDFLFACTTYPSDPTFMSRVREEAEYNIKRLRNHASLAMWCGNNEIYEGMRYWGWGKKYKDSSIWENMQKGYDRLFHQLLPSMVKEFDSGRFYMHSSPYEANWGRPDSWRIADSHNWGIWYGQKPFETLDTEIPRFMSEYGFQAFPEMKTISTFASPQDYALESPVMNAHQKATIGNALIKKTMALYYNEPKDFEELVYLGLVLQGYGIRHGIEAHRRHRPYCMGTLYWQLNDSWPVVSWSGIDYHGNWKAMHYQTQRAYAPILVNAFKQNDALQVYICSDKLEEIPRASMELKLMDFHGKTLSRKIVRGNIPANATTLFWQTAYSELAASPQETFLLMTLKDQEGHTLGRETYHFLHPKDQKLPQSHITYSITQKDGSCQITLKAKQLARDVFIETPIQGARFSDNFFDMLPGETQKVTITSPEIKGKEEIKFKIRHLTRVIR